MRTCLILCVLFGIGGVAAGAQQTVAPRPAQFTFKAAARLVVETVSVNDKNGKPVEGLTAKDFAITEDGVPQTVALCEFQKLADTAPVQAASAAGSAPPAPAAAPAAAATSFQIAPETAGNSRYRDRRLLALYFDMTSMPVSDQLRALTAAQMFLKSEMGPADLVAIMVYQGEGVKVRQDFTADRDLLGQALEKLVLGTGLGFDETDADADAADTGSAFGQDDSEFNIFNTNRQLAALQTAVNMLAPLSEKKSLVYFASGINLNGVDNQAQLEAATNAAVRANVSLFPVDARGLVAAAPLGDATQGSPGGVAMYSGAAAQASITRLQHTQDTLYALGSDTGGKALFDLNDLGVGIVQARDAITSYYILGYYTTNPALDGKYRRVRVALSGAAAGAYAAAKLAYRVGYYPGKQFAQFTTADKERQLEDALLLGDPITDLTIDLEVNYFQLNSAEYFVPIAAKIPGSELALAKKGGAEQSLIDFIGEVKDEYGTTVTNVRDKVELKLSGATAAQLAQVPIEYTTGVTLLPGKYTIKLLARDSETGRIGTYISTFTIPNLEKVTDRLPISTVVLSSQRVPLAAALFNAKKDVAKDANQNANPLVEAGPRGSIELMPSVTRVFSRRSPMYIYLQAYEHGATAMRPLVAYATFYRGESKVYETPVLDQNSGLEAHSYAVPLRFDVGLGGLAPGRYTCQVTVLDPGTHQANYWRAEVLVVP